MCGLAASEGRPPVFVFAVAVPCELTGLDLQELDLQELQPTTTTALAALHRSSKTHGDTPSAKALRNKISRTETPAPGRVNTERQIVSVSTPELEQWELRRWRRPWLAGGAEGLRRLGTFMWQKASQEPLWQPNNRGC